MSEAAYKVEGLSVSLDGTPILSDVSFNVPVTTSMAVIGPNGAGKTTLLRSLLRLAPGMTGRVELFGKELRRYGRRALARVVGYIPQAGEHAFPFTVEQFVLMARYPYLKAFSHFTETDRNLAAESMAQAGVTPFAGRQMYTLSGGERQKVHIAAALAQQPQVLLLDEATAFLDYRHQVEMFQLIARLRAALGLTIISVTHDLNQGALAFDCVLALKQGRTVFVGPPAELLREGQLETIYGTPFEIYRHPETGAWRVFPGGGTL